MVSVLACTVLGKCHPLFCDRRLGQEAGDSKVPARGRKLLETADGRIKSGLLHVQKSN